MDIGHQLGTQRDVCRKELIEMIVGFAQISALLVNFPLVLVALLHTLGPDQSRKNHDSD